MQRRSGEMPLTVDRHVADLLEVAPRGCALVGWSWGAMLALSFAARHPLRVRSLALVGIGTYTESARAEYRRRMDARLGVEGVLHRDQLRRAVSKTTDDAERDRLLAEEGALATLAQSFELLPEEPDAIEVDAAGHRETWEDVLQRQARGVEPAAFSAITAPVLMLHGADDPHPGRETSETLRRVLPQLEYVELARCGHLPWRERFARERFFELLTAWLAR